MPVKKRLLKLEQSKNALRNDDKYNFIGSKDIRYDGMFITAVKTTRIFCLTPCSAKKQNKENVIFYNTKEEALENGYRACKVCKP